MSKPDTDADGNALADYSVCMRTNSGLVYLSEFRTLAEAVQIAESAAENSDANIVIRQDGNDVRVLAQRVNATFGKT